MAMRSAERSVAPTYLQCLCPLLRVPAAQVLKLHDLVHAAHFPYQLTQLHCDADGPHPSDEALFHIADFDHSGTVSADGLTTHEPPACML
jgi:hypothetical protein